MGVEDMSFWNKFKMSFARFMQGRNGADQLGLVMIWTAVIMTMLGSLFGLPIFSLLSTILWVWTLFRMFSRNVTRRRIENAKFTTAYYKARQKLSQAIERFKNRKKFVYFECPQCHLPLRLPRGVGNVTVKCSKCGHSFEKKA